MTSVSGGVARSPKARPAVASETSAAMVTVTNGRTVFSVFQAMTTSTPRWHLSMQVLVSDCRLMNRPAVLGRLLSPRVQAIVARDCGHAQPIVPEDARASRRLGGSMGRVLPPGRNSSLVAPERQRQELVGIGEALKPLHRDEPVHAL